MWCPGDAMVYINKSLEETVSRAVASKSLAVDYVQRKRASDADPNGTREEVRKIAT